MTSGGQEKSNPFIMEVQYGTEWPNTSATNERPDGIYQKDPEVCMVMGEALVELRFGLGCLRLRVKL